uniref:Odorant-binding protein 3 n=1 Tax=Phyllotreta striolata TaxID=444603 RepID=A0A1B1FKI1_PHYSR|nr:odorant-binding protein 3 [Phyllotreta striolata]
MKYFVVFVLCFAWASAISPEIVRQFMQEVTKYGEMCIEETHASTEDVAQLMAHQIPTTHEGKCMISCVHKKFKIQNEDGTMNEEQMLNLMGRIKDDDPDMYEKLVGVYNSCKKIVKVGADHCVTALNAATCAMMEGKKAGLTSEAFGL